MKGSFKMSEQNDGYKLLKDYGELVPGMVFEMYPHNSDKPKSILNIDYVGVDKGRVVIGWPVGGKRFISAVIGHNGSYKLIHDPREVVNKSASESILKKISEHKSQISILEKELEKESLKNVFKIGSVYRIENKSKEAFLISVNLICDDCVWGVHVDGYARKIIYSDILNVWLVSDLKNCFWKNSKDIVFERKV